MEKRLLAFVSDKDDGQVAIHVDLEGVNILIDSLERIRRNLLKDDCPHDHLMTADWGGWELSKATMIDAKKVGTPVHHVKIYGWNDEWADKNGFDRTIEDLIEQREP
jgi:hypothetical protein